MAKIDYAEVCRLVPIETVLRWQGWAGRPGWGGNVRGVCPIRGCTHRHRHYFWHNGLRWCCHKCKLSGDAVDLYAAIHLQPLHEAARRMCYIAGVQCPMLPRKYRPRQRPPRNGEEDRRGAAGGTPAPDHS